MRFDPDEIAVIDTLLKRAGVPLAEVCRRSGVHATTWQRWRKRAAGDLTQSSPSVATWKKVDDVLNAVLAADVEKESAA